MKVLMLLKTTGLQYDDRIRKECMSLKSLCADPVLGVLDDTNSRRAGTTDYDVRFNSISLGSRKLFRPTRGLFVKTAELYFKCFAMLVREKPDALWIHDMTMGGMVPLAFLLRRAGRLKRLIWDQHELPSDASLQSGCRRRILGILLRKCDALVCANHERGSFLREYFAETQLPPFYVLENFPDITFCELPRGELPENVSRWLDGCPYLLTQGGGDDNRRLAQCVEAIMRIKKAKLIIAGRFREEERARLTSQWPETFDRFVHFTGMVPQTQMINYIDHALASVVLYDKANRNEWLCAPNRLYQAVSRGIPVITGCNPPLARLVGDTGAGVVLSGDGEDVEDLTRSIKEMLRRHGAYRQNAVGARKAHLWDSQHETIRRIVGLAAP
jgi:hypothetical protein